MENASDLSILNMHVDNHQLAWPEEFASPRVGSLQPTSAGVWMF
jgi:hypothetical protein